MKTDPVTVNHRLSLSERIKNWAKYAPLMSSDRFKVFSYYADKPVKE